MELGMALPMQGPNASPEAITRIAQEAERAGLGSVWAYERLLRPTHPIPMGGEGGPMMDPPDFWSVVYDPLDTLTYAAARTSRIKLGTSVIIALIQNPVSLARRLATIDRFSDGRLIAGLGQGWMAQEFAAAGVPMSRRGAGFEEHLAVMRAVWGPDPVRFDGRFFQVPESEIGPKPVRPGGPTVVVGAGGPAAVERAGRIGFGLTTVVFAWELLEQTLAAFRGAAEAAGHDARALPVVVQVNGAVADAVPEAERQPLVGSVDQVASDLERLQGLGVDHVYWALAPDSDAQLAAVTALQARIS